MIENLLTICPFPSFSMWISILLPGIVLGGLSAWLAGYCKTRYRLPTGYTRKIFHFLIFTQAGITGLWLGFEGVQVFGVSIGIVVGYAVLRGHKSPFFQSIARPADAPYEKFYIVMPFLMTAIGGMMSNILFGQFAIIGYITTGWGDAVGEPAGTRWGNHRYRVPSLTGLPVCRSLEGSAAVFLASLLGCACVFLIGYNLPGSVVLLFSLAIALSTMLVEAVTFHSMDNFTIQVTSSGLCYLLFYLWT